jgi:hypothetical protein
MRDDSYLESNSDQAQVVRPSVWKGRAWTALGATLSVVILAILVVWSYRLGIRDAADVPVIRAQTDAFKMRPEDPGGLEVAHQNRAIYTLVTPSDPTGEAGYAPASEDLAAEDLAPSAARIDPNATVVVAAPEPLPTKTPENQEIAALPAPVEAPALTGETESGADLAAEPLDDLGPAPLRAPAPRQRPSQQSVTAPSQAEAAEPRAAAAASSVQIQLGAFGTEEIAAEQWTALKTRNGDLLNGRARVITPVTSGGRPQFRFRAGPV